MRQGLAIAIGHPYPTTLEALSLWASDRDRRVRLISLGELVRSPATLRAASRQ
ncbi:MAG: divergent polysaccharide deacetylase family protein [Desulfovibrionales bacterium]